MYDTNKIVNKILGSPIRKDGKSKNRTVKVKCPICSGYGVMSHNGVGVVCSNCKGKGTIIRDFDEETINRFAKNNNLIEE